MAQNHVTLGDKYDLAKSRIFVTGYQALVRLTISELAKVTGPTARMLRFCDEVGWVPPAGTSPSGKHSTVRY